MIVHYLSRAVQCKCKGEIESSTQTFTLYAYFTSYRTLIGIKTQKSTKILFRDIIAITFQQID